MTRASWLLTEGEVQIELANTPARLADVVELRDLVYVSEEGRLSSVHDTAETFDRFDQASTYFVAYSDKVPVGAVKVIRDSELGLPCEKNGELVNYPAQSVRIEVGHLLSAPSARSVKLGMLLMRQSLIYGIGVLGATHVLGDFFADGIRGGGLQAFYRNMGFVPASRPYCDPRFVGSPMSIVGLLDVQAAARMRLNTSGGQRRLLDYFFADYPWLSVLLEKSTSEVV